MVLKLLVVLFACRVRVVMTKADWGAPTSEREGGGQHNHLGSA